MHQHCWGDVLQSELRGARATLRPLVVLDLDADDSASFYPRKLVLSRPDQHVAWRGDELPDDSQGLIDLVRGSPSGA
jgi:hypothetical protein